MNYLQLVNLVRSEAGVAGSPLTTVQGSLSEESTRFKNWVADEWVRLQTEQEQWSFLRTNFEFDTVADQTFYTTQEAKATDDGTTTGTDILGSWKLDSLRISTAGADYGDEVLAGYVTYEQFRNLYLYNRMRAERSKPVVFCVRPQDKALGFGITPNGAYTINGEFYRTPQTLSADADAPLMPARFHPLVAYRALRAYGIFMAAPEVIGRADEQIATLYPALVADQLPDIMSGPPLA